MSFQTSVLRDGHWVTETVDVDDALRAAAATGAKYSKPVQEAPECGILFKTVIESPIVRWILPVRLRSSRYNDIAFIGVGRAP
jgi:hypothetical protein